MKKTTFTQPFYLHFLKISILLLFCNILQPTTPLLAQAPYTPFPKGNISWYSVGLSSAGWLPYSLSIDTGVITIDNKIYNKVYFGKCGYEEYIAGVREEDKKIFLHVPELQER